MIRKKAGGSRQEIKADAFSTVSEAESLEGWSQVRRCHRCGHFHMEASGRVEACASCGARFAPFFFAEHTPESLERRGRPASLALKDARQYRPVFGVTWWWNESDGLASEFARMPRA